MIVGSRSFLLAVLLVVASACLLVATPLPMEPPLERDGQEVKKLQGTWNLIEQISEGKNMGEMPFKIKMTIDVNRGKITLELLGKETKQAISFKLNTKSKPMAIDLTAERENGKQETVHGIYKIEGDKLVICAPKNGDGARPTEFGAPAGSNLSLVTLRKAKE